MVAGYDGFYADDYGTGGRRFDSWDSDTSTHTWYIRGYDTGWVKSALAISAKELIAIAAAEKDRLHWTFKVVMFWLWTYIPIIILSALRLMFSLSGWLARVGKKRKSGK